MKVNISDHFTYQKLIRFTIPTIFMMFFTSIYGVVDGIFVSNIVGKEAFAAVNLIMPAIMIMGAVGFMIGTGGSAIVSKTLGEGNHQKANEYFTMLILLEVVIGVLLSMISMFFIDDLARLFGATGELLENCIIYGKVLIIGNTFFLLQNSFQSFMIVANKPKMGLAITVIAGVSNMILDFLLVYLWNLKVFGAALASILSQMIGAMIPIIYFLKKNDSLLQFTITKFERKTILKACSNGSSEMVMNLSFSVVNMLYNFQLMKHIGENGVNAYGIIMYVGFIFISVYVGYAIGSAPIIGYNYGAQNHEELQNVFQKSLKLLGINAIVLTALAEFFAKPLAMIFVSYDEELLNITITAIRLYSISYVIAWFNIFSSSFFTALNNGVISAVISFLRTMVFQIVMIYLLPIFFGVKGIWFAVVVAELLAFIVSGSFIIKNRYKYGYAIK